MHKARTWPLLTKTRHKKITKCRPSAAVNWRRKPEQQVPCTAKRIDRSHIPQQCGKIENAMAWAPSGKMPMRRYYENIPELLTMTQHPDVKLKTFDVSRGCHPQHGCQEHWRSGKSVGRSHGGDRTKRLWKFGRPPPVEAIAFSQEEAIQHAAYGDYAQKERHNTIDGLMFKVDIRQSRRRC